jgi:endonuclease/exonuclease/phosphatase family metal-dependent hydrolase
MAKTVRLGTYNVNNLFDRFDDPYNFSDDPWRKKFASKPKNLEDLFNLGQRILKSEVDILAMQEIESLGALKAFVAGHLGKQDFKEYGIVSIEGNDPRGIDLGVISKYPLGEVTSHRFHRHEGHWLFSRDCLEVDILNAVGGQPFLTLFVSHLKSQYSEHKIGTTEWNKDKAESDAKRKRQLKKTCDIVRSRNKGTYAILGDFNDSPDSPPIKWFIDENVGVGNGLELFDTLATIPCKAQFEPYTGGNSTKRRKRDTHKWDEDKEKGHDETTYSQLDYIFLSGNLRQAFKSAQIEQRWYTSGSDHSLCWADVEFANL